MRPSFRKIGLILSAGALFLMAVCLPLHHHEETAGPVQAHCDVCYLAGKARSVTPSLSFFPQTFFDRGLTVGLSAYPIRPPALVTSVNPRAPPAV